MSTSVSQRGPRRYIYYRCRSQAGGPPPCPGVNVGTYELERFVCQLLADVDDPDSAIPRELRTSWSKLDEREQQQSLPQVVQRVTFHHAAGRITLELREDACEVLP